MNRAYKLVWNTTQQAWTAASELAKGKTKSSGKSLKIALVLLAGLAANGVQAAPAANALPTGESVASGSASFNRTVANQLTVNQSTARLITNWTGFNVGSSATVNFVQPDAASIALNRVSGVSPTEIFGKVTANGQLVIVNPNGITFGAGSQVSAASIIGSVLDIQDSNFNSGTLLFNRGSATGIVDNQGSLIATAGGVALLAPTVKNSGSTKAIAGHASLINANVVNLSAVDPAIITASSINGLVQNTGSLQADKVSNTGGKILLVNLAGSGNGAISLSGQLHSDAGVTAQAGVISTGVLSSDNNTMLIAPNVNVQAVFDLNGSDSQLNFSSIYQLSSGAKINLNGANSGFSASSSTYTVIRNLNQLQDITSNLAGKYVLATDVDATATFGWNGGAGFIPVGSSATPFTGVLDGLGHVVKNLNIDRSATDQVGLFGVSRSAVLQNLGIEGGFIHGRNNTGALVGSREYGFFHNNYSTASVAGANSVGGLIGNNTGNVSASYASGGALSSSNVASVQGNSYVGGLVGSHFGSSYIISNSYASGTVFASGSNAGGLVGWLFEGQINNSYATGWVEANNTAGGLVGSLEYGQLNTSYASGKVNVSGAIPAGGLVGTNNSSSVSNSYWDINTTGKTSAVGINQSGTATNLIGVYGNSASTPSAYNQGSYTNFDFNNNWFIASGSSRPMLRAFLNTVDADGKIAINTLYQLQGMAANLAGKYYLTQDIDATASIGSVNNGNNNFRSDIWGGAGFAPVGNTTIRFTGVLDGLGHVVKNLKIQRTSLSSVGLIGVSNLATIQNIGLRQADIRGSSNVGGLVGDHAGTIKNSFVEGVVTGAVSTVGGIVGSQNDGTLDNTYFFGTVSGPSTVGGLAGLSMGNINFSYATGSVIGSSTTVGGLVGWQAGSVSNSYSTASVSGTSRLGGLAGYSRGTIANSYASGAVSGSTDTGGLIGYHDGAFTLNSYWDVNTTGKSSAIGTMLAGGSSSNLVAVYGNSASAPSAYNQSSYANFDFNNTWFMANGASRPMLRTFLNAPDADGKIAISNLYQLQGMAANLAGNYYLTQDIDASATADSVSAGNSNNRSDIWGGRGFAPVGNATTFFTGQLNGMGHVVSGLNINRPTSDSVGLIGRSNLATIQNIGIGNASITGRNFVGGLVGYKANSSYLSNSYVAGNISGNQYVGGLTGVNEINASITNSYAAGNVSGNTFIGGIAGHNNASTISNSYATANVTVSSGGTQAGGLVGNNYNATVSGSYATGSVGGSNVNSVGGLIGINDSSIVTNSYATGSVSGAQSIGGLIGSNYSAVSNSYASGGVNGSQYVGGLIGANSSVNVNNNYWDKNSTGQANATGFNSGNLTNVVGLTSNQMKQLGSFANWGINIDAQGGTGSVWRIYDGYTAPLLRGFLTDITVDIADTGRTYDGSRYSGGAGYTVSATDATLLGSFAYAGSAQGARHAGSYNISATGLYSNQQGYDIKVNDGTLTINKADLVLTSNDVTKTYDGTTSAAGNAVVGSGQLFDMDSISGGTFAFDNKHAGSGKHVTVSGVVVNDGNNGDNYNVSYADNTSSTINKADLVLTSTDVTKTYDGTANATGNAIVGSGQLFDADSISGGTFAFDNKHAGSGKHVTVSGVVVNDGNNGDNYNVSYADNTSSTINKADLVLTSTDVTKTYDGTANATGNAIVGSGQLFDADSISGGTFAFDNKHAGSGKHVTVSGVVVNDGNNGDNYNVSYADNTSSTINKRLLTITAVVDSKVYDGKLTSIGKPAVAGRQRGDSIASLTQAYTEKNAGAGKTLRVNNYVMRDGNNGNNYDVVLVDNLSGVISPKVLTISTVANSKVYDGGVTAANKPMVAGLVAGDRITGLFQRYEDRYVGENKRLLIKSGYVVQDGNTGQNYIVTEQGSNDGVITAH